MNKKLLILMSSLHAGGAERQTVDLINNINADRFSTTLRYFDKRDTLLDALQPSQVDSVECLNRRGRFDPSLLRKINELIDRERFDMVVCISPYATVYGNLVRKLFRKRFKLVTVIHHTLQKPGRWERVKSVVFKKMLDGCDLVIFVCKNQLDYWVNDRNIDVTRCRYVYNGIDLDHFTHSDTADSRAWIQEQYDISASDVVLGNVARFRSEKRQEDIVQAVSILRESGYPIKALLVGDGPRSRVIEHYIESKALQNHVFLTGLQNDVRPYLRAMDCFVISSHQETFSMAALEAMAAGKPLIMTDVGGAAEMLDHDVNGFLYPPGDVEALVENVKKLIDRELIESMGNNSKTTVTEKFTLTKMVSEYENILLNM